MIRVVACLPTYRPEPPSFLELVHTLTTTGISTVISDDGSPCTSDPLLARALSLGARVIRHRSNTGIARGLNDGLRYARERGADWLLTVDQDSAIPENFVQDLLDGSARAQASLGAEAVGAVGAGLIHDASGDLGYPTRNVNGVVTTAEVIQTGTLWSVRGLLAIGGFDESFGIDAVDAAACVRLRSQGRYIVVLPDIAIAHRLGRGRKVRVLGRTMLATGHSARRRTTMVRNRLRLAPEEFRESPLQAFRSVRRVAASTALAVTVEDDRWAKAKASARGLFPRSGR